jgi:hypothetical protein
MGRGPRKHGGQDVTDDDLNSWTLSEAKARVAELFDAVVSRGPQTIVGPDHEFQLFLTKSRRTTEAKELLLSRGRVGKAGERNGQK